MRGVYLIDRFLMDIAVSPYPRGLTESAGVEVAPRRLRPGRVRADNVAVIRREVVFSRDNTHDAPFKFLRYQTQNTGVIRVIRDCGPNDADGLELGRHADFGDYYLHQVIPRPGGTNFLEFEVLKGFDRGHRHAHFHLPKPARMREVVLRLDLADFTSAGFTVSQEPSLYYHRAEPPSHDFCQVRCPDALVEPGLTADSSWTWVIPNVGDESGSGVVDVCWDVAGLPGTELPAEPGTLDHLIDNEASGAQNARRCYALVMVCLDALTRNHTRVSHQLLADAMYEHYAVTVGKTWVAERLDDLAKQFHSGKLLVSRRGVDSSFAAGCATHFHNARRYLVARMGGAELARVDGR